MNPQDILSQMMGGGNGVTQEQLQKAMGSIDIFIDRVLKEKDYTLHALGQEIYNCLQPPSNHPFILQIGMRELFPHILKRIEERMQEE